MINLPIRERTAQPKIVMAFSFGVIFVIVLVVLAVLFPSPSPFVYLVFRVVLALAAAGVAAVLPGFINVEVSPTGTGAIRAGGALAIFVIVYFFNPAKLIVTPPGSDLTVSTLRVIDDVPGFSLLDIVVRNRGDVDAVIHQAVLRILDSTVVAPGGNAYQLPSTYQYNALVALGSTRVPVEMTQVVPAGQVDRFQFTFLLGQEDTTESPWGPARIRAFNDENGTAVTHIETSAQLLLEYNENQAYQSEPFSFTIRSPGSAYRARQIAGIDLNAKIEALASTDVNVVESLVEELAAIGDAEALALLEELQAKDHAYLSEYYESEIITRTDDPDYWALPSPSDRMAQFERTLDRAIALLNRSAQEGDDF